MNEQMPKSIEWIMQQDGRYPAAAAYFVQEGLQYTVEQFFPNLPAGQSQHVTGQQLCLGLHDLALHRWGLMARYALRHWNINYTRDFGEIIYILIGGGWLNKQENDGIDDFNDAYNFDESFEYSISVPKRI
ncbi:MAG: hypothetical protein JEZ07_02145 [Phycisphaerae bacterium]|nr:hypothetical protein [Phycisphaerae bacterium]